MPYHNKVIYSIAGDVSPLLLKVAEWLNFPGSYVVLSELHKFLKENENFKEACKLAVNYGVEKALGFLQSIKRHLVKTCQENKYLMKSLAKIATKSTVRYFAMYGVRKLGS